MNFIVKKDSECVVFTIIFLFLSLVAPLSRDLWKYFSMIGLIFLMSLPFLSKALRLTLPKPFSFWYMAVCMIIFGIIVYLLLTTADASVVWLVRYLCLFFILPIFFDNFRRYFPSVLAVELVVILYFVANVFLITTNAGMFLNGVNRFFGFTDHMIVLSGVVNIICLGYLLLFMHRQDLRMYRRGILLLLPLVSFNIVATASRSIAMAAGLLFIISALATYTKYRLRVIITLSLGSIILPFIVVVLFPSFVDRFFELADLSGGSSLARSNFLNAGLEIFLKNIFFGAGAGTTPHLLETYVPWEEMPAMHFDLLLVLAELGLLGLVLTIGLMWRIRALHILPVCFLFLLSLQNMIYYAPYLVFILIQLSYFGNPRLRAL
jgi:hypothetical protein